MILTATKSKPYLLVTRPLRKWDKKFVNLNEFKKKIRLINGKFLFL